MSTQKILLSIAALFLLINTVISQPYYFRHYQVEDGLSNNAVISCLQDKKGFLWFGTKDGLNRFDGYFFKTFRNHPGVAGSIGNNFIHHLYEDPSGHLWVGTEKGLYKFDFITERFDLLKGTANIQVSEITSDNSGNLWFISGFTLLRYAAATGNLTAYPSDQFFEATSVCVAPDGAVWVATANGLLKKYKSVSNNFESFDVFGQTSATTTRWIEKIYASPNGHLLVGTSTGVKMFDTKQRTVKTIPVFNPDKTDLFVRNFLQTSADEYWIGTESGIFIYNSKSGKVFNLRKSYNDPYSLSDNAVYTFCIDREGGLWAGTYFGGINYYPKPFTPFKKHFPKADENSLSGNVVREICEDRYGNLWIGTEDAGLNKLNTASGEITHFGTTGNKSLSYSNIHGLLAYKDELWIGTFEHGLDVLHIKTGKVIRHYAASPQQAIKSNFIYSIYQSTAGDIMIGTTIGAYIYQRSSDNFAPLPGMPLYNWYTSLLQDDNSTIWAGTFGNGINYYNTKTGQSGNFRHQPSNKNSIGSDRVNSIFMDSKKNLWFATEGGLCRYNATTNNFTRYTTENGLPSNFTISILEDEKQHLWISTTKGLVCFDPLTEQIKIYTKAHGLLSDQFNFSAAYKDKAGRMYFGSAKGLISFHPDDFKNNNFIPPVYITGFQVFNKELPILQKGSPLSKSINYTSQITLEHYQSTFSIDFAALSYTAPQMSEYAYQMEGLQKTWTYLNTNRKVYFTNLSPGMYTFKIKASNGNGTWNKRETKLTIKIRQPWWASWWAKSYYALGIIFITFYSIRSYRRKAQIKNKRKIELLQAAKEKELYEAKIDFFTNVAHEIKTPLTLIKGPLEKVIKKAGDIPEIQNSLKIMNRNTERLVDLTNQLLDFRQTEIKGFSLNFIQVNISELLEETFAGFQPLAEQKGLQFNLQMPPDPLYAAVDLDAFSKILANLFSNAVKYAASKVSVCLLSSGEWNSTFTLIVKNDGYLIPVDMKEKVFEPFFRLKETEKQKGTGIGLALSRSLSLLHQGQLQLAAPEDGCNTFVLTLPLQQAGYKPMAKESLSSMLQTTIKTPL